MKNNTKNSNDDSPLLHKAVNLASDSELLDESFDPEDDALFGEIQAAWDEMGSRIEKLLAADSPAQLFVEPPRTRMTFRTRRLTIYALLSLATFISALYWGLLIPSLAFNTAALVTCIVVEVLLVIVAAYCINNAASIFSYNPFRERTLQMPPHVGTMLNIHKLAVACIAALLAITVASCATTGGDGYYITRNNSDRTAVVDEVSYSLYKICRKKS